jgi:hypothetical protein
MARKRVTIEQAIKDGLADADKGKPCSAISLMYVKGMGQEEIHTKQLTGEPQSAEQLAQFFISRASGYAQDLPGISNFKLLFFYGSNEPQSSQPFTVVEGEVTAGGDIPFSKHEPTPTGLLGQLMKHNEVIMSMQTDMVKGLTLAALQREEQQRKEVMEAQMIVRDVIFNMKKEAHEARMAELTFQRETQERMMIGKALPSILAQLTGRDITTEGHADSELIDAIASKVSPEQIKQLMSMGVIPQEVGALLVGRFAKAIEKQKQEVAALQAMPPENSEVTS